MALEFTKLFKSTDVISQVGNFGFFKLSTESSSGGGDVSFSTTFSENTPEQISAVSALISANNMTSAEVETAYGWKLGDTKDITLSTGEVISMRIIGFNHDNLTGGGTVGITLDMVAYLTTKYQMNSAGVNTGGYPTSDLRNIHLPTIKTTLPKEWIDVIKMVDKQSANGGSTNYTGLVTTSEDLFILSEAEACGTNKWSLPMVEGTEYEYYKTNTYKKGRAYWLRTPIYSNTTAFVVVNTNGELSGNRASGTNYVSFAFCI